MQKRSVIISVAILVLGVASIGFAQFKSQANQRELGYYDRSTGSFIPLKSVATQDGETPAATATTTTGSLVFKFTITAKSAVPKNGVITCQVDATISDSSGFSSAEHASGVATLASGTTYDCTATINYSWSLASASTDKISYTTTTEIGYGYQITATNASGTVVEPAAERSATHNTVLISVPANGVTTTEDVTYTL
jgi:hypothetical protein